jgi:hypothetical protein
MVSIEQGQIEFLICWLYLYAVVTHRIRGRLLYRGKRHSVVVIVGAWCRFSAKEVQKPFSVVGASCVLAFTNVVCGRRRTLWRGMSCVTCAVVVIVDGEKDRCLEFWQGWFCLIKTSRPALVAHSASFSVGTGGNSPRAKRSGYETDHWQSGAEVKHECMYNSIPPPLDHALMMYTGRALLMHLRHIFCAKNTVLNACGFKKLHYQSVVAKYHSVYTV